MTKFTIIDKYLIKELLLSSISVFIVLLAIMLSTEVVHLLKWVTEGVIPLSMFFSYITNSLFEFSISLFPLVLLLGILLAFGRLYRDSEMTAIISAGIGPMQWYRPLLVVVIPATLLLFVLMMYVQPLLEQARAQLKAKVSSQTEIDNLMVGQFNYAKRGGAVLFIESKEKHKEQVKNVFFQQRKNQIDHVDLASSSSTYTNEKGRRYMMMHNGTHYSGNAGEANFKIIEYKDYGIYIDKKKVQPRHPTDSKNIQQLLKSNTLKDKAELQWRITVPIGMLFIAIMALPLSYTNPRSGRYAKLAIALVIYLVYSNLLAVGRTWIVQQKVPIWVGTWWVHLLALGVIYYLLKSHGFIAGKQMRLFNKNKKKNIKRVTNRGV